MPNEATPPALGVASLATCDAPRLTLMARRYEQVVSASESYSSGRSVSRWAKKAGICARRSRLNFPRIEAT